MTIRDMRCEEGGYRYWVVEQEWDAPCGPAPPGGYVGG